MSDSVVIQFQKFKDTKNTTRYKEVVSGGQKSQGITDLYIEQWQAKALGPDITITIESTQE